MVGTRAQLAAVSLILAQISRPTEVVDVSIIALISNPEQFDGRRVVVSGFCSTRFEDTALYLHQEDYEWGLTSNAIWVDTEGGGPSGLQVCSQKYGSVIGTFTTRDHGHMGGYVGTINHIERVLVHPDFHNVAHGCSR